MAGDDGDDELVDGASTGAAVAPIRLARSSSSAGVPAREEVPAAVVEPERWRPGRVLAGERKPHLTSGGCTVQPGVPGPVDCHVGADPVAFLLVSYGRQPLWRPILDGKLTSWGRRPWKSLAFKRLLVNP